MNRNTYFYRLVKIPRAVCRCIANYITPLKRKGWGKFGKGSWAAPPLFVANRNNCFIGDNVRLMGHCSILNAKGICKIGNGSGASNNLTIVTDNHFPKVGEKYYESDNSNLESGSVIIDEDVWIGVNVTILSNVHIGRGAVVGASSVLRGQSVPPYSIVVGNPAKVVGFRYTPEEILMHEKVLYEESDRLTEELLNKNYDKFYIKRIRDIKNILKL